MATRAQIAMIHTLKSRLGMSDDNYRAMLGGFGVSSSKDLKVSAAKDVIEALMTRGGDGFYKPSAASSRHASPAKMALRTASDRQVAKIRAMWNMVSRVPDPDDRARALNNFIERRFKVSHIKWLARTDVGKVIRTLEVMIKSKEKGGNHDAA